MSRLVDHSHRTALLDRVVRYLGHHGLVDMTYRPMAKELGVSVNALVHHFGSKDELLTTAVRRAGRIQRDVEDQWRRRQPTMSPTDLLRWRWRWLTADVDHLAVVRLAIESVSLECRSVRAAGGMQLEHWRHDVEQGLVAAGVDARLATVEATLARSVYTGLVVDLVASGQKTRLTRAWDRYVDHLDHLLVEASGPLRSGHGATSVPTPRTAHHPART